MTTQTWDATEGTTLEALTAFALDDLAVASTQTRSAGAWAGNLEGGHLFLRTWGWSGAIDAYGLASPGKPELAASVEVDGAADDVEVAPHLAAVRAYAAAGYRGVRGFDLK